MIARERFRFGKRAQRVSIEERAGRAALRRMRLPSARWVRVLAIALAALAGLLGGGWLWLRDSSLVAVQRVTVTGVSGPDAAQIRRVLVSAARNMTTLDVRISSLRTAVAPYPVVRGLRVRTKFPHAMRIQVIEEIPVATVRVAGEAFAVAADGMLLRDLRGSASLPLVPLSVPPGGPRLTDRAARSAVSVLAAAPYQLLAKIAQARIVGTHGITVQLRSGPSIYFGDPTQLSQKWLAATAVLADPGSEGAAYIDVSDPSRPVAGAGASGSSTAATTSGTSSGGG